MIKLINKNNEIKLWYARNFLNLRQEKFKFFRGELRRARCNYTVQFVQRYFFFFFCFIKDHRHLKSRDLKKKKKKRWEQRPGFYKYRSFDRIRDRWYTYVFRTTGCVNTIELATIIGMLQTWWNFANPLQQICQSQYYLNYETEKSRGKKIQGFFENILLSQF